MRKGVPLEKEAGRTKEAGALHNGLLLRPADFDHHAELARGMLDRQGLLRPGGTCATRDAGDPGKTQAVATVTAANTPIEAWHSWGMKLRVQTWPPATGGATSAILGTTLEVTSPRPIGLPAPV